MDDEIEKDHFSISDGTFSRLASTARAQEEPEEDRVICLMQIRLARSVL